jgi:hypothetical protein
MLRRVANGRYRPICLTPARVGIVASDQTGIVAAALMAWAAHACSPVSAPFASPVRAIGPDVISQSSCVSACSSATARAGPKQSAAVGTTDEPRAAPARLEFACSPAMRSHAHRRQARSGASLEVWSPTALAGCGALIRRMPATGLFPLRRSRHRPARLSAVPTSMTTALAVLRSRRRELEPSNVADGSGFLWRPVRFSGRDRFAETPFVFGVRCSGDRWHAPSRGTRDHMQSNARPHQPAPARACLSGGESFAAAVSRTRRSGLAIPRAPQPGRTVRFFPRPVAAALLGLHPSQVCSRPRVDARGIPRG